jgi:methylated-DNA-[protein]-cysteine S-methyltransferase
MDPDANMLCRDTVPVIRRCLQELDEYFSGSRETFTVSTDISRLTKFQQNVLELLRTIPFGTAVSYGELAERAGVPGGGRAVGNVMKHNPIPIMYPCHRVVRADGSIGGFGMGSEVKRMLLLLEQRTGLYG